jgi:hypothetical protein
LIVIGLEVGVKIPMFEYFLYSPHFSAFSSAVQSKCSEWC